MPILKVFVEFARPHTIVGTVLAVVALWLMARALPLPFVGDQVGGAAEVAVVGPDQLVLALVAALATNVFIVGINQVTDVEIDRINKPWLPIAAGDITMRTGHIWVWCSLAVALGVAALAGPYMLLAVVIGSLVGAAYSLPPLRLKRFHLAAAASITSVRALTVNLLVFAHFVDVSTGLVEIPTTVWALTGMVLGLTIAIAWFKDLPDAEGDAAHGIGTLVLRIGVGPVVAIGLSVLGACYVAVMLGGLRGLLAADQALLVGGHAVLLVAMISAASVMDTTDHESLRRFYSRIWLLFFAEYVVFPVAVLAA